MGIKKNNLITCEPIYWIVMNRYRKPHTKLLYMSWFSANEAKGKNHPPWNPRQTMVSNWSRHVYPTETIFVL